MNIKKEPLLTAGILNFRKGSLQQKLHCLLGTNWLLINLTVHLKVSGIAHGNYKISKILFQNYGINKKAICSS